MITFTREDCQVFARYPESVSWQQVRKGDQEIFKSIRGRLKQLSEEVAATAEAGSVDLQAKTSLPTPNGRSPREIWCCVYPVSVLNKSYSLQVALIISERGAEICFCVGSETSQVADPEDRRRLETILENTRDKLKRIPPEVVTDVERSLGKEWFYRESWRGQPGKAEFKSLREWLNHASTPRGNAASVSMYLDPNELTQLGDQIAEKFRETLRTFTPFLDFVYGRSEHEPRRIASTPGLDFDSATLLEGFEAITATNLQIQQEFFSRFVTSLAAKPFVILTGNSGTGKTKLAQLFAEWLTGGTDESHHGYAVIPVGADWTDNRNIVGFVNHLRRDAADNPVYQGTATLDLLLSALAEPERPFFLILDEMNLSHVERYFADFLSAMESRKAVRCILSPSCCKRRIAERFHVRFRFPITCL
jgi:hypothetical protein